MDLLVINPNTTASMTRSIGQQAEAVAGDGTRVIARNPSRGPAAIENAADEVECTGAMLEMLDETPADSYDAIVVACGGDPGVAEIRAKTGKPVIGIGEASMLIACMYGGKFSAIVTSVESKSTIEELVDHYGLGERFGETYATELSVLEIAESPTGVQPTIEAHVQQAIDDGASAVTLTCAAMGELALPLSRKFEMPIIDGVQAAVKLLEAGLILEGVGERSAAR